MNGFTLDRAILEKNIAFIREEYLRVKAARDCLIAQAGSRSDDAGTILKTYDNIIRELNYLLQYSYDAEY